MKISDYELKCKIESTSNHNDGWTRQFYKDELTKIEKQKDSGEIHPKRAEVAEVNADALFADGFDEAICGFDATGGCAVYDYNKCLKVLCDRDEMSREEAHEYMEFNVVSAYVGDFTPIFIHTL